MSNLPPPPPPPPSGRGQQPGPQPPSGGKGRPAGSGWPRWSIPVILAVLVGTLLLNHTLDALLAHRQAGAPVALIGPTLGCLPDALFRHGVTTMAGTWITDRPGFLAALARGESWTAHARKFSLQRGGYPGLTTLLARSCA